MVRADYTIARSGGEWRSSSGGSCAAGGDGGARRRDEGDGAARSPPEGRLRGGTFVRATGDPVVFRNAPLLPRRHPDAHRASGWPTHAADGHRDAQNREGGVRRAESEVDADGARPAHTSHTQPSVTPRSASQHIGPRPSGGVGGTRRGVGKHLHLYIAHCWPVATIRGELGYTRTSSPRASSPTGTPEQDHFMSAPVAAIDCGTDSVRLPRERREVGSDARKRSCASPGLGQGVDSTGRLRPPRPRPTLDVLHQYRE